ncbi:MAG: D-alanyl-D-alanine carboxypeptidase family protein [Bacilli bacterium]
MKKILLIIMGFFVLNLNVLAEEDFASNGKSAILVDNLSGKVLYEKNADEKLAPASMTKLASMLMVMEAIDNGNLKFEDKVTISEEAANMGGSQVFLQAGEVYTVYDLLKSVAIASGNDAVVALAEKIGGSQSGFIDMLNKRLKEIGATNTNFVNAHGLDAEGHYSTARDMSIIARELLKHPKILEFTSIYEEYLEKNDGSRIWLVNTNKLVRFYDGVDGLKTGFTKTAGYCLTATASKNNFRLISVVMGEDTSENRSSDTVKMLNYGFNTFKINIIKTKGESLGKVRVEKGKQDNANIVLLNDATEILKNTDPVTEYSFNLKVNKIKAPVKVGDIVGTAEIIDSEGNIVDEVDVTVEKDIKKANILDYMLRNLKTIGFGKSILKQN